MSRVGWRSFHASPDTTRSERKLDPSEDVSCVFCGRDRSSVEVMVARPVIRTWTDTGEVDSYELAVCDVCIARAAQNEQSRRCDLCQTAVADREFTQLGMAGTVCSACKRSMNAPDAQWLPRSGSCVNCGRDLATVAAWQVAEIGNAICRRCAPPA